MRRRRLIVPVLALGIGAALAPASTASAHPVSSASATKSVVVDPVTSAGKPAKGYTVLHSYADSGVDCSDASSSPGAMSANIDFCSPSAAYAIACWKASTAHAVLCLQDAASHHMVRFKGVHGFTSVSATAAADLAPLRLVLTDGTICSIRDGGAWGPLPHHPNWDGVYSCTKHGAVWATSSMKHYGVNETKASWTVHTAAFGGSGKLTVRHVKKATFVGTA